jgi:hypothetical protein
VNKFDLVATKNNLMSWKRLIDSNTWVMMSGNHYEKIGG